MAPKETVDGLRRQAGPEVEAGCTEQARFMVSVKPFSDNKSSPKAADPPSATTDVPCGETVKSNGGGITLDVSKLAVT